MHVSGQGSEEVGTDQKAQTSATLSNQNLNITLTVHFPES